MDGFWIRLHTLPDFAPVVVNVVSGAGWCWESRELKSNLLSRWHQLQLKLICEETQEPQLVNWRQAVEGRRQTFTNHTQTEESPGTSIKPLIQKPETGEINSYWGEASSPRLWNWWSSSSSAPRGGTRRLSSASRLQFRQMGNRVKERGGCYKSSSLRYKNWDKRSLKERAGGRMGS